MFKLKLPALATRLQAPATFAGALSLLLGLGLVADAAAADTTIGFTSFPNVTVGGPGTSAQMQFQVGVSGELGSDLTVSYQTADGTAVAGTDYTATAGKLTIPAGQTSALISVPVIGETYETSEKTFTLTLSNPLAGPVAPGGVSFIDEGSIGIAAAFSTQTVSADFNGDGKPDVAISGAVLDQNGGLDAVLSILINNTPAGASTVSVTQQTLGLGLGLGGCAVGDFNHDGKPDLIFTTPGNDVAAVLINTTPPGASSLSFATTTLTTASTPSSYNVTVADFNADGLADFAIAGAASDMVAVYINTTQPGALTASFKAPVNLAVSGYPYSITAGDFNGDGKMDLAVGTFNSFNVSVLLNTSSGTTTSFAKAVAFPTADGVSSIAIGDFNNDGKPDIATANLNANGNGSTLDVFLNTTAKGASTPSFTTPLLISDGAPATVVVADINKDGLPDLIVGNESADVNQNGAIDVFLNGTSAGATTPIFTKSATLPAGDQPASLVVTDLNGDGLLDLVSADDVEFGPSAQFYFGSTQPATVALGTASATGTILYSNSTTCQYRLAIRCNLKH